MMAPMPETDLPEARAPTALRDTRDTRDTPVMMGHRDKMVTTVAMAAMAQLDAPVLLVTLASLVTADTPVPQVVVEMMVLTARLVLLDLLVMLEQTAVRA